MTLSLYAWFFSFSLLDFFPFVRFTSCSLPTLLSRPLHILQVDAFFRHLVERRKLTQTLNGFDDAISNIVHLGFGIEAADAEANRTVRQVVTRAQSLQYIRWLKRRRGACRTAGNGDVVDPHQQRLTFHVREANVQVAGQAMLHRSVDVGLIQTVHDAVAQAIAQARQTAGFLRHFFLRDSAGLAQAHDTGNVQGPRAHATLVVTAVDEGGKLDARIFAADGPGAGPLG